MINRQAEIKKIIKKAKSHIYIPNLIEYKAALEGEDERLQGLFNTPFAEAMFSEGLLKLSLLEQAKTLKEMTSMIDGFIAAVTFFTTNYRIFSGLVHEPFFQKFLSDKGELTCWNELANHSFKKLNYNQAKVLVIDALTRMSLKADPEQERSLNRMGL